MPETVLEQLRTKNDVNREAAEADYLAVLARSDKPGHGDADKLHGAMTVLGMAVDEFEKDVFAVTNARKAWKAILTPEDHAASRARIGEVAAETIAKVSGIIAEAFGRLSGRTGADAALVAAWTANEILYAKGGVGCGDQLREAAMPFRGAEAGESFRIQEENRAIAWLEACRKNHPRAFALAHAEAGGQGIPIPMGTQGAPFAYDASPATPPAPTNYSVADDGAVTVNAGGAGK
jgi:hypothetical protein